MKLGFNRLDNKKPNRKLGESTLDDQEKAQEVIRMMEQGLANRVESMSEREREFVLDMSLRVKKYGSRTLIAPNALFWLRDLKEKYL